MNKKKKSQKSTLGLIIALAVVVVGSLVFVGAVGGWFSKIEVTLDAEYYCDGECDGELTDLTTEEYEELVSAGKSFLVFIDQGGCTTADRLRGYVKDYARGAGVKMYRMMFEEVKKSSLHDAVKYYPSVAMIRKGKPVVWLRADEDEDAEEYNNYETFKSWMEQYLDKR